MNKQKLEETVADGSPLSRTFLLVIMLGGLTAFGPLSIDMYLPALPSMARDFASPTSQVQLTLAACLAGLALGQTVEADELSPQEWASNSGMPEGPFRDGLLRMMTRYDEHGLTETLSCCGPS